MSRALSVGETGSESASTTAPTPPKRTKAKRGPDKALKRHPLERFEMMEIARSRIKNAEYNPRTITTKARKQLSEGLQALGLLEPLIWNQPTGNLVGGHQRIKLLDGLADGAKDYLLTVAAVDLTAEQEVEANILLNNPGELLHTKGIRVEATGFSMLDVHRLLGDSPMAALTKKVDGNIGLTDELADYHANFAGTEKKVHSGVTDRVQDEDFYLVLVFDSSDAATAFLNRWKLDETDKYINGADFIGLVEDEAAGKASGKT